MVCQPVKYGNSSELVISWIMSCLVHIMIIQERQEIICMKLSFYGKLPQLPEPKTLLDDCIGGPHVHKDHSPFYSWSSREEWSAAYKPRVNVTFYSFASYLPLDNVQVLC